MEQERKRKKKRGREEKDEAKIMTGPLSFDDHENSNTSAKKRDLHGKRTLMKEKKNKEVMVMEEENNDNNNSNNNNKGCFNALDSSSSNLGLGVFDFPWLKDGVMSKSEQGLFLDYCEDSFMSSLERNQDSSLKSAIDFSEEQYQYGFCGTTPEGSSSMPMPHHIPQDKLLQDLWQPFESDNRGLDFEDSEDLDCIWSSLLNKPL